MLERQKARARNKKIQLWQLLKASLNRLPKQPCLWYNACGWVRHNCIGLTTVTEYTKYRGQNFLCAECSTTRRSIPATQETIANSKLYNIYTSYQNLVSYGSRSSLKKESNGIFKQVGNFLRKSETYTKSKLAGRNFTRPKVRRYRLNEIWSNGGWYAAALKLQSGNNVSSRCSGYTQPTAVGCSAQTKNSTRRSKSSDRHNWGPLTGPPVLQPRFCRGSRPVSPNP